MRSTLFLVLASTTLASGCAAIVSGTRQVVSVETHQAERPVDGASCEMVNSKNTYFVTTPGTVTIDRAYGDLSVRCTKAGMDPGEATVVSATKAMAFGNILFGGAIGVVVDTASGAAYDYPERIRVGMGESTTIGGRDSGPGSPSTVTAGSRPADGSATAGAGAASALSASAAPPVQAQAARGAKPVAMEDLRYLLPAR
ncbi:hypothetical protein [Cupriavidus necator]|uniref:hypothetical protein n=1 Tax=Cupriavidus necator TaxID=106590 RepID=UPI00278232FA|nr:hypothetical protein [Cupriavidus necator]MDQ0140398.1 uncharacterized protein YceK [Cupriavidus necator]